MWSQRGTRRKEWGREGAASTSRRGSTPLGRALKQFSLGRTFLQAVSSEKVRSTNLNCSVIADVRHDGSEPCVDVLFGGLRWGGGREGCQAAHARPQSRPRRPPGALLVCFFPRRRASPGYARRSPHCSRNVHSLCLPHPGQGYSGKRGQARRWYRALTAQKSPTIRF